MIYSVNTSQNKARVGVLISGKVDFGTKNITRDKEGCLIIINPSICQDGITILNIYALNNWATLNMR